MRIRTVPAWPMLGLLLLAGLLLAPASARPVSAATFPVLADFEDGLPVGFVAYADSYDNSGSATTINLTLGDSELPVRPAQSSNKAAAVDFNIVTSGSWDGGPGYGGLSHGFAEAQDWSSYDGFSFWFYGGNTGLSFQSEIFDNGANAGTAERFDYTFVDNFTGWRLFEIPFSAYSRATDYQPGGALNDGLTLTAMWGYAFVLAPGAGSIKVDQVALYSTQPVDDFETGLPSGTDANGNAIGFSTFQDANSLVAISAATPPAPVPSAMGGGNALQVDTDVNGNNGFAGVIHAFENGTLDTWVTQDWSRFAGISFWLYGNNTGSTLFIDLLDNRAPNTTTDTAGRHSVNIVDDFAGWRYFRLPFSSFAFKPIGNGAPNDGLTLTEMNGWAFGVFDAGLAFTNHIDDVALFGVADVPALAIGFAANETLVTEGGTAAVEVKLTRSLGADDDDPAQVSIDYSVEPGTGVAGRDYTPAAGTLTFTQGGPSSLSFSVATFNDPKHDGDKTAILRLSNPVDVAPGFLTQAVLVIEDDDPLDETLLDDFERGAYLWDAQGVSLSTPEVAAGDPLALPGQAAYEHILQVATPQSVDIIIAGKICKGGNGVVTVAILTTDTFNALSVDENSVRFGAAAETHRVKKTNLAQRHVEDFDRDGDKDLVFHFRASQTGFTCASTHLTLTGMTRSGQPIVANGIAAPFGRDFAIGQDWSRAEALSFWFYGTNSGDAVTALVKDNRASDPGPAGWSLAWSDEFNGPAGTPPNPATWSYEIGDGSANRIPGWGNEELQFYTSDTANSAMDGGGNLVITAREDNGSRTCYYGPCQYTSARLISQYKAEFAYGRIESRIRVPEGAGLWPAFWSLGTDIAEVGWPQTGEIDIMEFVGRLPNEVFGTIHGPGYSGGNSFGNTYTFGQPVSDAFHTFAIDWQPDLITWTVDGILYHTADPADVAPNQWVFNDPVFLILNMAIGGNFGGAVGEDTTFPQSMTVDYVRVYQGPDTAERWEASFTDNFSGWQKVVIPFSSFTRGATQPAGAPNDGLNLDSVWGYGFTLPEGGTTSGVLRLDQARLELAPPPTAITVTSLNDHGKGSLRQALDDIAIGGTITFAPSLAGGTIALTSGPLAPSVNVTVDASAAPGLSLNGGGADRVLVIDPGLNVTVKQLTVTNGYGYQLAGGILNNGDLTLDHVVVSNNRMTTDAGDFWQGGGGIYSGGGASLTLVDSSVLNNQSGWSGGGVYSFFNTTTTLVRSTIAGNIANDVGGGLRLLGNASITNSTISGNTATGWYGGALFLTDGTVAMTNSTVVNNTSPDGASAAVFVGTFGPGSATLNVANSIIAGNQTEGCFLAPFGAGPVAINSLGNNVFSDATCFPVGADQVVADAGVGPLADNGGPTQTHALLSDSPAIDAANGALCPATDQRGTARPQGAGCDGGSFERVP